MLWFCVQKVGTKAWMNNYIPLNIAECDCLSIPLGLRLFAWINFNPIRDKQWHSQSNVRWIIYPIPNFNGCTIDVFNG